VANHRAETRGVLQRRRAADPGGNGPATEIPVGSRPGKRRAVKPRSPAKRTPARATSTHTGSRKTLIPGIPSAPTLVGATALAVAAVGAVTVGAAEGASPLSKDVRPLSVQASLLNGTGGSTATRSAAALSGRERAISRDSRRQALQAAADEQLQAVAERQAKERNAALAALAASAEKQATLLARKAWQLPVTPGAYRLTSRFGECSGLWSHCHTGLDFAAPTGTPIHAVANGTVTEVGSAGAYGNRTIVTLEDGTELWYCHQSAVEVTTGQHVRTGEVIGLVGATGNTTGPHLHLEVRPGAGDPVDPFAALVARGLHP
jgi:murein DD-endopeptidase MepM/ murein hydrolase activator NlpD